MANRIQILLEQKSITENKIKRKSGLIFKNVDTTKQSKNKFDSAEYFMNKELCETKEKIIKKINAPKTFKKVVFDSADYYMDLNTKTNVN